MAQLNSTQVRNSRYVSGGTTEVTSRALEWWERAPLSVNEDDDTYVIEARFEGRLDLITTLFLGEPRYWWVIAQYNNILDPYTEVTEGTILYIPTLDRVKSLLQGKTGGVPSTRVVPTSILPIV